MAAVTKTIPTASSTVGHCPACGQRVAQPLPPKCPYCEFPFFDDDRVTGSDVTPYARGFACGEPGWRRMSEWVWFSGRERLKHMALMRASAASRRFAHLNIALLAVGLALCEATQTGWEKVTGTSALGATDPTRPTGAGWLHVAAAPRPLPPNHSAEAFVDLWWNPIQTIVTVIIAFVLGFLAIWLVLLLIQEGVARAHKPPYRAEQRMTAALHYSTAWGLPLFVAALLVGLKPLSFIGGMSRWAWYPPDLGFILSAAVIAAFAVIMWWFWFIRLGATAPARTCGTVVGFFTLGVPLIVIAVGAGWWFGIPELLERLFPALELNF